MTEHFDDADGVFQYRDGQLSVGSSTLRAIAESTGTPLYIYSLDHLLARYRALEQAFAELPHLHCVALKSNSQPALVRPLADAGAGAEVVSGAELALAVKLGFPSERIVFSGVGKTDAELEAGLAVGVRMFLIESEMELSVLDRLAGESKQRARVALRLNPNIDAKTHPGIATGIATAKFGIDLETARELYARHRDFANLEFSGIHSHIGSQIVSLAPLAKNAQVLAEWVRELRQIGVPIKDVDVGGGLGIAYHDEVAPSFDAYASEVAKAFDGLDVRILTEPGRSLFGPIGVFVARVLYLKQVHGRRFVVLDAGLNDLLRPALYNAYHRVWPLVERVGEPRAMDIVGAVCESTDVFGRGREMVPPERGDMLAILDAGAYGFVMSSNYNLRPQPAEVVVEGNEHRVVRRAETQAQLVERELAGHGT